MDSHNKTETRLQLMPGLFRQETNSGIKIVYHWYAGVGNLSNRCFEGLLFLSGLAAVFLSYNGIHRFSVGQIDLLQASMSFFLFIIGVLLAYRGLALAVNHSDFLVSRQGLTVVHSPLPFPGAARVNIGSSEIASVEWQKVGHSSQTGYANGRIPSGYSATFDITLHTNTGRSITLLPGVRAREYAFAVAGEVTKYLKIAEPS
ncbi:MAG: hypothetical protein GYA15_11255 [Leptolinea sp.]|jgi:hypothetical protein|nr:hypothetical protein [Leptolinea sp.]